MIGTALVLALLASLAAEGPPYGRVVLPDGEVLTVEIADTPARQARGYMFRDAVGPEDGMLFPFADEGVHTFWMKNVRIPLDMLWIGRDGVVLHVERDVPPCAEDPCPSVGPMLNAGFVLELAGGRAASLGLEAGARLQILMPPGPPSDR